MITGNVKRGVESTVGLAISAKKLFPGRRNRRNKWLIPTEFRLFLGTENSRNSVPNHSEEDKNARNSIPLNRNTSKLLKIFSILQHAACTSLFYSIDCAVPNHVWSTFVSSRKSVFGFRSIFFFLWVWPRSVLAGVLLWKAPTPTPLKSRPLDYSRRKLSTSIY